MTCRVAARRREQFQSRGRGLSRRTTNHPNGLQIADSPRPQPSPRGQSDSNLHAEGQWRFSRVSQNHFRSVTGGGVSGFVVCSFTSVET